MTQHQFRICRKRLFGQFTELAEPFVDSINLNAPDAFADGPVSGFADESAFHHQGRRDLRELLPELRVVRQFVSQILTEEAARMQSMIHAAESFQTHGSKTVPHRIANDERTGDDSRSRNDAQEHRKVCSPVMSQAS